MCKKLIVFYTAAIQLAAFSQTSTDLFNGKDLTGWVQRGGAATYEVAGDEIVGTSVMNTPNSFLCTEQTYGDFILEYDFKVDGRLNSGVQIRSECFDQPTTVEWQGQKIRIPADRVHGYQVEIDPDVKRNRMWSAGIYEEGCRKWLYPAPGNKAQEKAFTAQGRKVFKPDEWNHVRVEARGDSIKTWLNGELRADLKDGRTARGFIGLQVHGIGNNKAVNGTQVRWRNLRLTDLSQPANSLTKEEEAAGWRLLWDGESGDGWRGAKSDAFPTKGWTIKDGMLMVNDNGGEESAGGGDIITQDRFTEFELMVDFKLNPGANSGIKYFVQPNLSPIDKVTGQPTGVGSAIGLEFQILDDAKHPDAKLGRDGNRTLGSLYDLKTAAADKPARPLGEWNTARIVVEGDKVEHWLNGVKILEYERGSDAFRTLVQQSKYKDIPGFGEWPEGHILLQEHGDPVSFRNIKIRVPEKK